MVLCIYAYRNCLQNARFSLLYAIDAKYRFDIIFPNSFRNYVFFVFFFFCFFYLFYLFIYFFFFFFFCGSGGGTARQDYFTHFEPSQSLDAAKTGDPQNKTPGHPQAELGLSHVTRVSGEMTSGLECF